MKITIEELKGLNVKAYIDWLIEECEKMEIATLCLPLYKERRNELILRSWDWHMYEISKMQPDKTEFSYWYNKYDTLAKAKIAEWVDKIEKAERDLELSCLLASPENVAQIVSDEIEEEKGNLYFRYAQTIDFKDIRGKTNTYKLLFNTSVDVDTEALSKRLRFDKKAIERSLTEGAQTEYKFLDWILDSTFCREFFFNSEVCFEFAHLEYLHRLSVWGEDNNTETEEETGYLEWGNKTELSQLIHALSLSKRIRKNGEPISQDELTRIFENLFGCEIKSVSKNINQVVNGNRFKLDNEYFIKELYDLFDKDLRQKANKTPLK